MNVYAANVGKFVIRAGEPVFEDPVLVVALTLPRTRIGRAANAYESDLCRTGETYGRPSYSQGKIIVPDFPLVTVIVSREHGYLERQGDEELFYRHASSNNVTSIWLPESGLKATLGNPDDFVRLDFDNSETNYLLLGTPGDWLNEEKKSEQITQYYAAIKRGSSNS